MYTKVSTNRCSHTPTAKKHRIKKPADWSLEHNHNWSLEHNTEHNTAEGWVAVAYASSFLNSLEEKLFRK